MPVEVAEYRRGMRIGATAYLDTNFVLSVVDITQSRPLAPKLLFADLLSQNVTPFVSALTLDEVWWTLLDELNRRDGHGNIRNNLKNRPELYLDPYTPHLQRLVSIVSKWPRIQWLGFKGSRRMTQTSPSAMMAAVNKVATLRLMPRDAFHIQYADSFKIETFVTSDPDFNRLHGSNELTLRIIKTS